MAKQPEGYIQFEVYEGNTNYMGVAKATLPQIQYLTQTISGAGLGGNIESVLAGMVDAMTLTLNFNSPTDAAASLAKPTKHEIQLLVAEQYWSQDQVKRSIAADKFTMVVVPKTFNPGGVAPASAPDVSGDYAVYYYKATKGGKVLWEIDPRNYKCVVAGVDYSAAIRKALGKA